MYSLVSYLTEVAYEGGNMWEEHHKIYIYTYMCSSLD
jgi:hypothetical protein